MIFNKNTLQQTGQNCERTKRKQGRVNTYKVKEAGTKILIFGKGVKMKSKLIIIVMSFGLLLTGCTESSQSFVNSPEDALKSIEVGNEEREINVYGSYKVSEELELIVFRGVMNDKDIWVADVHKVDGKWVAKGIVQMNGPFKESGDIQTLLLSDEFGHPLNYELGYIKSDVPVTVDLNVFEIEGISDWKIWIKEI